MRHFDFVSIKLTFFLILGIIVGNYFEPDTWIVLTPLLSAIMVLIWAKRHSKKIIFDCVSLISFTLLGMLVIGFSLPKNQPNHYLNLKASSTTQNTLRLKITEVLKSNTYTHRYFAQVQMVNQKPTSGKIIVYQQKDSTTKPFKVDNELYASVAIEEISSPLNPYQFNFKNYLKKQGVCGVIYLNGNLFIQLKDPSNTLRGMASNFRANLIKKLEEQEFGEAQIGVIQALLLGQRDAISDETYRNYKNAGALHVLAISGLHIGILLLLLRFVLQPLERLPKGKTIKLIVIVFLLWGYAFVAGLSPSIVRAVTMFSFLAYALHLNRPTNTFNILALSLFVILLIKPLFLFQVGLQMSYIAVFAILWIYPKLQSFWQPKLFLIKKGWQFLSVSLAAQVGVLPISLFYFHQFPLLFFASNLAIVPFLGIILGFGILVLALTHFSCIPTFLVFLYDGIIKIMNIVIAWVAHKEAFLFTDISFDSMQLVLGYVSIIALVFMSSKFNFKNTVFFLIISVLFSGYLVLDIWKQQDQNQLWLLHQSKSTVLLHQNGNSLQVHTNNYKDAKKATKSFEVTNRITYTKYNALQNHYNIGVDKLLVIDSLGIYGCIQHPDYVLLTQSPKLHLERFLDSIEPKVVLADGSNYKSYIYRWRKTCQKRKLPFHYTGKAGAYQFK